MMDMMYTIPSDDTITKCIVTKDMVDGNGQPMITSNQMRFRA